MVSAGNLPHQQTVEEHARQKHAREKMTLRAALAKVVAGGTGMSGMGLAGGVNYQTVEAYCGGARSGENQCSDTGLCRENQLTGGTQQSLASS